MATFDGLPTARVRGGSTAALLWLIATYLKGAGAGGGKGRLSGPEDTVALERQKREHAGQPRGSADRRVVCVAGKVSCA